MKNSKAYTLEKKSSINLKNIFIKLSRKLEIIKQLQSILFNLKTNSLIITLKREKWIC